jgi:hypothetical protein
MCYQPELIFLNRLDKMIVIILIISIVFSYNFDPSSMPEKPGLYSFYVNNLGEFKYVEEKVNAWDENFVGATYMGKEITAWNFSLVFSFIIKLYFLGNR